MKNWKTIMVPTDRGVFEVFTKGKGAPLCVSHLYSEFNETGDHFADMFTESHQVFLINLREAGRSEKAHEPHQLSMIETVLDLEAVRDELGYPTWHFAGHSTGGMLGLVYGIRHSKSLETLIITSAAAREYASSSPFCIYHPDHPKFENMQSLIEQLKTNLSAEERNDISRERAKLSLREPGRHDEYFAGDVHKSMAARRMEFFSREILLFDVTRQLHKISTRTLVACGQHDVQCPIGFSEEMAELIPDVQLAAFDNSNHYPFLEEKKAFQKVINKFYQQMTVGQDR
ncbi:proline iminopeptidase [Fictibacillus solisalsi]|uniref:Proline iminopeptidase n=1 Tax=Fictibacillus solisalsi TaxID=459525 RepID=A0A1G9TJD5_9BACL|nr:alpha/beta hydrolase [Fictibacillus solisalsi]SDM47899.1 proline iminopeptidase [Fictibacillus solisalsi]